MRKTSMQNRLAALVLICAVLFSPQRSAHGAPLFAAPVASSFSTTVPVNRDSAVQLQGSDADGTALTFAVASGPSHGSLGNLNASTGAVVYTPATNYTGADSFTYTVTSGGDTSTAGTVTLSVSNAKTRIVDTVVDSSGAPRRGKVTFVLTQPVTSPAGLTPAGASISASLNTAGQFDISIYPSRSLSPQAYYQVWFEDSTSLKREMLGVYDVPFSTTVVTLAAYKITDTNLSARYVFASEAAVSALIAAASTATLSALTGAQVATALGFTPENSANKGAASGYAGLDSSSKVQNAQLADRTLDNPTLTGTITGIGDGALPSVMSNKTLANPTLTGTTTVSLGSDATGDLYYTGPGGAITRLAIGGEGQVLAVAGGVPSWTYAVAGLYRTTSGRIYEDTFSTLTGWTSAGNFTADSNYPTYVAFARSPVKALERTVGGLDQSGLREGTLFVDGDGTWYLFYWGGGSPSTPAYNGRIQWATSTNKGLSWVKQGYTNFDLQKTGNPADGYWAASDVAFIEKRGTTYYLHRITCGTAGFPGSEYLCGPPYGTDLWKSSSISANNWTYVGLTGTPGSSGSADEAVSLLSSIIKSGSVYYGILQATSAANSYSIVHQTASSVEGAWTKVLSPPLVVQDATWKPENPKMFWSEALGRYVLLTNEIFSSFGRTTANRLRTSSQITTGWDSASGYDFQGAGFAYDADTTILNNAVGVPSLFQSSVEGLPVIASNGCVPFVYDADPVNTGETGSPYGRTLRYNVLEPSRYNLRYNNLDTTQRRVLRPLTNSNFIAEYEVDFRAGVNGSSNHVFLFRVAADGNSGWGVSLVPGAASVSLLKVTGASTFIAETSGALTVGPSIYPFAQAQRVKVVASGTSIKVYVNGELAINYTLTTGNLTGTQVGFSAYRTDASARLLYLYSTDSVTVGGVQAGDVVTLRGAGGVPYATTTASSTSVTLTSPHFPLESVEIRRSGAVLSSVTPTGKVWGGDAFTYSTGLF